MISSGWIWGLPRLCGKPRDLVYFRDSLAEIRWFPSCNMGSSSVGWAKAPCAVPISDVVWEPAWKPVCGPVRDSLMGTRSEAHPTEDCDPVCDPMMGTSLGDFAHPTEDSTPSTPAPRGGSAIRRTGLGPCARLSSDTHSGP